MIEQLSVAAIYAHAGFDDMIREYKQLTDPLMPEPAHPFDQKHKYLAIEAMGWLTVYGALRLGKIVGFATCIKGSPPHYGSPIAIVESLYLMRDHRASGMGIRLIEACEDCARIWALPQIFIQVHEEELNNLGTILERRNYSARIHTYGKRL